MRIPSFEMERWQSTWEHRVPYNLSDSGVHPYTLGELAEVAGLDPLSVSLAYTQTNGSAGLRERIAALYPGAGPENVVVTTGAAEANFLALWCLLAPGDRVAVLGPTYGQTPGLAEGLGAEVVRFWLEEARAWQLAPGAALSAVTQGTRLLVVTNPNNPTGSVLSEGARAEVVRAAARAGAWVLSDEVYAGAEMDGRGTPSLWGAYERTVVTGSLSKAYGLPGLRLGWAVAPPELATALWAAKDYTTIAPPALSDAAAAAVLEPGVLRRVLGRTRRILRRNLSVLTRWLDDRGEIFSYVPPRAGAICFVRHGLETDSRALARRLRSEGGVLVVPGAHFGMEGYLRIGFGIPRDDLVAALDRMAEVLEGRSRE